MVNHVVLILQQHTLTYGQVIEYICCTTMQYLSLYLSCSMLYTILHYCTGCPYVVGSLYGGYFLFTLFVLWDEDRIGVRLDARISRFKPLAVHRGPFQCGNLYPQPRFLLSLVIFTFALEQVAIFFPDTFPSCEILFKKRWRSK